MALLLQWQLHGTGAVWGSIRLAQVLQLVWFELGELNLALAWLAI